jgi:hypothetical protein
MSLGLSLRRFSPAIWGMVALIFFAALPDSVPIGPIRFIARYLIVGYLPGLVVWNRFNLSESSLVDLVLYPSLLSILPFSCIGFAAVALGANLRVAAWIAVILFAGVGLWSSWKGVVVRAKGEGMVLGVAAVLAMVLVVIPFAANSFQAVAWDAPLHAAIVSRILAGFVPPDSPMMAGQRVNYYWLYHFYSALLMRITGLSIYQVFALLNVHAFVLFVLGAYRIASRVTVSVFGRFSAVWMLVFGLNAFGWIIFLANGSVNPDKWYSLVVPFAMVKSYSPSLGSLIHEFLDGFPFPVSFVFDIAWLDIILARLGGKRGRSLVTDGLILATVFYLHPLSAVFLAAASLAAVIVVLLVSPSDKTEAFGLVSGVARMMVAAALVTVPYAWDILRGKTGVPLSVSLDPVYMKSQGYSILATMGLIGIIAAPGIWLAAYQRQCAAMALAFFAAIIVVTALMTHIAFEAEYKLIYLLAFGLTPLVALAWDFWRRTLATRVIFVLALAVCVPTNALTSYCFTAWPPRENRDATRLRLLDWIRKETPINAILVEYPWWEKYQTSDAAFLYLDRFYFDIAVYANRRQLIGCSAPMLQQWGYRDIGLRSALMEKLINGRSLERSDQVYLAALRAPIIVVTSASALGNEAFDSAVYRKLYEDGDIRAYDVVLLGSSG